MSAKYDPGVIKWLAFVLCFSLVLGDDFYYTDAEGNQIKTDKIGN